MALSLLCGGLGVAEATVHVNEGTGVTHEVYTTGETYSREVADAKLDLKADKTDVATNTANINNLDGKLSNLTTTVNGKADAAAVTTALDSKADTDLSNLTAAGETKIKNTMSADMDLKANKADVNIALDGKADKATVTDLATKVGDASSGLVKDVATLKTTVGDASSGLVKDVADLKTQGNDLNTAIGNKADQSDLDAAKAKITTNETNITALQTKTTGLSADGKSLNSMNRVETDALKVTGEISNGAGVTTTLAKIDESMKQTETNKGDIADLKSKTDTQQTWIGRLNERTTQISYDPAKGTTVNGVDFMAAEVDAHGKGLTGVTTLNTTGDATIGGALTAAEVNAGTGAITGGSLSVIGAVNGISVNAGTLNTTGDATVGGDLSAKNTEINGTLHATGATTLDGALTAKGEAAFEKNVTMDQKLTVTGDTSLGALNVTGESSLKNTQVNGTLTTTGKATFKEAVDMDKGLTVTSGDTTLQNTDVKGALNVTGESNLKNTTVDGTLSVNKETTLNDKLTANGEATFGNDVTVKGTTNLKNTTVDGDLKVTGTITTDKMVFGDKPTNYTEIDHGKVTSKNLEVNGAGQAISSSSTFDVEKNEVGFGNGITGDHSYHKQTAKGINGYVTDKDGNKTYTKVTATENSFQVQDKDGKNKNHQVNTKDSSVTEITNGDGKTTKTEQTATDITNTAKDGTIKNEANHIENTATTMKTTVTGQATEDFKGGLNTKVTGAENHTVTGKQTNTVEGGQENIISGGQTNTITGDQTTTITGNKNETVTENVTEDYKKNLTTTVGGNEIHDVKGTKTETVEGKLTENFKDGQETNVSGTQTINATDINRNASSGMIDTVDNAYGTNKETKVAGSTTTEVSIKGTRESGTYIRGATEARDYIIKGTLSNSETKTAEATSTEITDGNGKTSATIQDKTQISGSVTNGTSSAVSNVKADSIDTAVKEGTNTSLISQKKDSITSAVGNGTTSTVIQQGDKDITIASNGGTVGIVGKDIINNATDEITNTAGTKITDKVGNNTRVIDQTSITDTVGTASRKIEDGKITDTAGDSTVTTENGKGTTFAKTGSTAYSTKAGAPMDTNIAGNHITTGRVDANELAVSDKDGDNTADFSVKAGEGVKASAGNGTTTGSLDVTGDKVESSVKDGDNETSIKQTATDITNTAKDGTIKNDAKDIMNEASKSITNKVGDNTSETMKDGEITTSIKDGAKKNTVISTADGTSFFNSEAWEPVTGASSVGTAKNTTIKGNTITTGKVTMDYAEVMKDLGVRGNANITGKTTTGSLEVTGTSTLKGDVTMESNATVKKDLTVNGITTTKTLKVTENAEIDGNATIAGDVTANSYKVGDKTYIDANGIHANGQKITDVADGSISEGSKDAVNGGQLYGVKRDLEHQVDKVGANAAAMANLRPMEFDPSSKWNIAAAIGNYGSETAAALGAFYRPNDDVMVNLSTAFGTGENMVGGGVSVRLGKGGNKLSREENNALKDQVNDLTARMDALLSVLNPNMSKDFPDVPENHWAYEAVSRLAGNDIVQGYPDGEFHGERTMTRYEMAEIIYNALSRGAEAEKELVEEFKPELQAMAASEKATAEKAEG